MKRLNLTALHATPMPTLFDFDDAGNAADDTTPPVVITVPTTTASQKVEPKKKKPNAVPDVQEFTDFDNRLAKYRDGQHTATQLLSDFGFPGFKIKDGYYHRYFRIVNDFSGHPTFHEEKYRSAIPGDAAAFADSDSFTYIPADGITEHSKSIKILLSIMAPDASVRTASISFLVNDEGQTRDLTVGALKTPSRYSRHLVFIQSDRELTAIVNQSRPWVVGWLNSLGLDGTALRRWAAAPWLETLSKAGYAFADRTIRDNNHCDSETDYLNRLCQTGTRPKDIFKTPKAVYETLKAETDLKKWDCYRRMAKSGRLTGDAVTQAYAMGLDTKHLDRASHILGRRHDGKPFFTWETLMNYLRRLDTYEAIPQGLALEILDDYLAMCSDLGMTPRTDGDSLKREHDIAARLSREKRNEEHARRMAEYEENVRRAREEGTTRLARLEYHESLYFVRPIISYDDLIDEAKQQHNCVASYGDRIAKGECHILTMRESAHPERSLVTIELAPDLRTVRQKYLAYNQSIRNKSINEFIQRWVKQICADPAEQPVHETLQIAA